MPEPDLTISPAGGTWVIRAAGAVIGETARALEVTEAGAEPVVYFPREDVEMAFLDPSGSTFARPGIGEAENFTIVAKSGPIPDAAWSFAAPAEAAAAIRGHIAFREGEKVTVERL